MLVKYKAKFGIAIVMFISTIVVGGVVWYVSDILQTEKFSTIFRAQLVGRFARQAEDERTAFDKYIRAHNQVVKIISNDSSLQ
ncbi:MAG: hypothetical protein KAS48_08905, partial [Gammaproteobacteria bacterium]|nr:hypothetical protein [Gammaproteobacteria bacterium]